MRRSSLLTALLVLVGFSVSPSFASQTTVAVAANFTDAAKEIAQAFKQKTGDEAVLSFGATGQLYTQVTQGAPFEILLSADAERPHKAVADGLGVSGSTFTYAVGKLVLWSKSPTIVAGEEALKTAAFEKLSICNPQAAPYGEAAVETMKALKLEDALKPKLVVGANISQAYQFVDSGNAEIGFVALSQLAGKSEGSRWLVPQDLYKPILQDAVLLTKGSNNPAAIGFLQFLKGPEAHAIIEKYGYGFSS